MRRPRATVGAATCAVALLAGCSNGGSSPAHRTGASHSPAPVSADKARTLAAAAVLTAADMPGYRAKPQQHDAADAADAKQLQTCLGTPAPTYVTRNFGTAFTKGTVEVDSSADVATSAAGAAEQLRALTAPSASACFERVVKGLLAASGITVRSVSATPVPAAVPGSDGTYGYQLAVSATAQGTRVRVTGFTLGSLVGPVEIDVSALAFGNGSIRLAQVSALLTKVTGRVRAAA